MVEPCPTHPTEGGNGLLSRWWGPAWWTVLYSVAELGGPSAERGIRCLAKVLPCKPCRDNFEQHLVSYPNPSSGKCPVQWLRGAHALASGRESAAGVPECPRATPQSVAFVARCIAVNYPLEPVDARCEPSWAALSYLAATFPSVFRADSVAVFLQSSRTGRPGPGVTRPQVVQCVENALRSSCRAADLEQLRFYQALETRLARYTAVVGSVE